MANALVPSFRLPISIPEDAAHPAVREALLTHDNGLVVLNQALKTLNSKVSAATSTPAPSTTTVTQNSETIVQGSAGNTGTVNNQSGNTSYATQQSDNGALIVLSDASPVALSLTTSLVLPWFCVPVNQGAGLVTITPAAGNINGGATITLPTGYFAVIAYDGANFWAATQPIVPVNTPAVAHQWLSAYNAATGAFTQTQPAFSDISGTPSLAQVPFQSLTTTGTSGVSTLVSGVLNIPDYSSGAATVSYHAVTSSSYSMVASDRVIGVNFAGAVTITMVSAASVAAGTMIIIKDESGNAGTNNITINPQVGQTIEGLSSQVITTGKDDRRMYSTGSNWFLF